MDQPSGPPANEQAPRTGQVAATKEEAADGEIVGDPPPPLDDDDDVADAEIVEWAAPVTPSAYGTLPSPDYSDAGVPSLDYVRDKIEGRHATAIGSVELAEAGTAREAAARAVADRQAATAEEQRLAREQAGRDKLEEIRRSLRP